MIRRLLRPVRPRVAAYFRRRLLARGHDVTVEAGAGRALILAPHADDEAIGCGALIARKAAAGTEVLIVVATDGRFSERADEIGPDELARIRRIEAVDAARSLGLGETAVRFLGFEDTSLPRRRDELARELVAIEAEFAPDEVFIPHPDEHPDHRTLNEVARAALVGATQARCYEYPVRYWGRVPWITRSSSPGRAALEIIADPIREWRRRPAAVVWTEGYIAQKRAALDVYAGEMESVGHFVNPILDLGFEAFFPLDKGGPR